MGGLTLFVLLHGAAALVGASIWLWGRWQKHEWRSPSLTAFLWPRRLVWLGVVILFVGLFVAALKNVWLDFTPDRTLSLTSMSLGVLDSLSRPVEAVVAFSGRRQTEAVSLLEQYHRASALVQIRTLAETTHSGAQIRVPGEGILLRSGEREEFVATVNEEAVTNALARVGTDKGKVVYVLAGHGEPDLDDTGPNGFSGLKQRLTRKRFEVRRLLLVESSSVPTDADLLVVSSGSAAPLSLEQTVIATYLRNGGAALFLLAPGGSEAWQPLLSEVGIMWDPQWQYEQVTARPVKDHPLAQMIPRNSVSIFSGFFPLKVWGNVPSGAVVRPALVSDESATLSPTLLAARAPGQGFLVFGITGEYPVVGNETRTRLAVFGGQGFATNVASSLLVNQEVILGCIRWLTQGDGQVQIPPPTGTPAQMIIAPESLEDTFVLLVLLPPEIFLLAGVIWLGVKGRL